MDKKLLLLATIVLTAVVLVAGLWNTQTSLAQLSASGGVEVAVCDVVEVFNNYERAKDLTAEFQERRETINEQSEARRLAIEEKGEELNNLREGSAEYERQLQELQRMVIEAQTWAEYQESLARRDYLRLTTDMYEEILDMVTVVAEELGYSVVLFRETRDTSANTMQELLLQMQNRKVLYSTDEIDITGTVLSRINIAYAAQND